MHVHPIYLPASPHDFYVADGFENIAAVVDAVTEDILIEDIEIATDREKQLVSAFIDLTYVDADLASFVSAEVL